MKNIFFFICLCWAGIAAAQPNDFRKTAPKPGPPPKIQVGQSETFKLPNGLTVIVVENHKLPRVTMDLFVDVPPMVEKNKAGASQLAGQLLSRGSNTRNKADLDKAVDRLGASLNSNSNGVQGACLSKNAAALIALLADVALQPKFDAAELEKIKKLKEAELQQIVDDADQISARVQQVLNFGEAHPYGELFTEKTLANIEIEDCKAYYNNYFKPNISYLVLVGDITLAQAKTMANQHFAAWSGTAIPKKSFNSPTPIKGQKFAFIAKPGAVQSVVNITYPVDLQMSSPNYMSSLVMNTILGGYFRSRINNNLREDKGYTYGAGSGLYPDNLNGTFSTYGSYRNEVTDSAIMQLLQEMRGMIRVVPNGDELQKVKNVMSGNFARSLEAPNTVGDFALNIARYNLRPDYYETYLQRLERVSADAVLDMAKIYIQPDNANIVVIGNKDKVFDAVAALAPDKKLNFYDTEGLSLSTEVPAIAAGVTAEQIVAKYVASVGDATKIKAISTFTYKQKMNMQGQELNLVRYVETGKRVAIVMKFNGVLANKRTYNFAQNEGFEYAPGTEPEVIPEAELPEIQEYLYLVDEISPKIKSIKFVLKGTEKINNRDAYIVDYVTSEGKTSTHYFDMATGDQVRIIDASGDGVMQLDFSAFTDFGGLRLPKNTKIVGAAPQPLMMETYEVELNVVIPSEIFEGE